MISFRDIVDRALKGPIISGKDFDLKILVPSLKRLAQEYDITYDPHTPVPAAKKPTRSTRRTSGATTAITPRWSR